MMKKFIAIAVPSIFCTIVMFVQHFTCMVLAGHMHKPEMVAAIGMGNTIQNCFFMPVIAGLNSAAETLVSQAVGAKDFRLCGLYLNTGRVVITCAFIIQVAFGFFTEDLLLFCHQDPVVSKLSQKYILYLMPGLFFYSQSDLLRKFLNSFGKNNLPLLAYGIASCIFPFMAHFLAIN